MLMLNNLKQSSTMHAKPIQIQPMLMLNSCTTPSVSFIQAYSNTTYVNVKRVLCQFILFLVSYSNTTYVNVKLMAPCNSRSEIPFIQIQPMLMLNTKARKVERCKHLHSNTTYVNVKPKSTLSRYEKL